MLLILGIPLANAAGNAQNSWLEAIEKRLAVTSKALDSMKAIKMAGAVKTVSTIINALRDQEIASSGLFRIYTTFTLTVSYASEAFAPVIGFGTFIILSQLRGTETLTQGVGFAALTLFELLDQPMASLVDSMEDFTTVANCFERVQDFLVEKERQDYRLINGPLEAQSPFPTDISEDKLEKSEMDPRVDNEKIEDALLARAVDVTASWSDNTKPTLNHLNFTIPRHKITMVVGPVGSGKSTLLRLLLGELPTFTGQIITSFRETAFCSQAPWLQFGTIQHNILGSSVWDLPRYQEILTACDLSADIQSLAEGDQTKVGSKGSRLSGGQQMRVVSVYPYLGTFHIPNSKLGFCESSVLTITNTFTR